MRFRQIHLDFHTSEAIQNIGSNFSKRQFQEMLQLGHVDSITVFAKCHHGWAYFTPAEVNETHPNLSFDLLSAQIEACQEINVATPVYISAGLDEKLARRHPDWLIRNPEERTRWAGDFMTAGYHEFCFGTPYLDVLVAQTEEVVRRFGDGLEGDRGGIFLDIVGARTCVCQYCVARLRERGQDPRDAEAVKSLGEETYANYTRRINEAIHSIKPEMRIFHNSGHIARGRRDLAQMNTHLELESLPTGGWGYDHFPLSARYVAGLGMDYLGMTGKFHTTWGEFGGYKHPNALRYEAALNLANGARCSVGDQLHPDGLMDEATYAMLGEAYAEVEQKEPWIVGTKNVADIGILSLEAAQLRMTEDAKTGPADTGALRMLLEAKFLFDVLDLESDFSAYKVLILPDAIRLPDKLAGRLQNFVRQGGKVLATGESGLKEGADEFALDFGVRHLGPNPFKPDYFRPEAFELKSLRTTAFVMYSDGQKIELSGGEQLGAREDSYFNRDVFHFCSHQHTPNDRSATSPGIVQGPAGIYIAWNIFEDYTTKGSLHLKELVVATLDRLLGDKKTLETDLGSQGIVTLTQQDSRNAQIVHLLYATPTRRGAAIEVIEDLQPVYNTQVRVRVGTPVKNVTLAPQGTSVPFETDSDVVSFFVPRFVCHQMVVLEH